MGGTVFSGVNDVLGAGCAKSFRSSFPACALRIFATISGFVLDGGGTGSWGLSTDAGLAGDGATVLPLMGFADFWA